MRDPQKGYREDYLYLPLARIQNLEGLQAQLTFPYGDGDALQAYGMTDTHMITPREFIPYEKLDQLPFTVIDQSPLTFPEVRFNLKSTLRDGVQEIGCAALVNEGNGILSLACGKGKAQPVDEHVATPAGWARLGDIRVGDAVIGSDGRPTRVTGVFPQGTLPVFRVTFDDGAQTRCCEEHLWLTQTPGDRRKNIEGQVRTLKEIRETISTAAGAQHSIPRTQPVHFSGEPVWEPWLIGFYLGDGSSGVYDNARRITLHKADLEIHEKIADILRQHGVDTKVSKDPRSKNIETSVRFKRGEPNPFWEALGELQGKRSYEKFIPKPYMLAPIQERLELLNGLLTSDGHRRDVGWEYCTSSERLARDIQELVEGLGGRASIRKKSPAYTYKGEKKAGRPSYRLLIHPPSEERARYQRRYIKEIEPVGEAPCVCISVAAEDRLYLTSRFLVTHNTVVSIHALSRVGVPGLIVVPTQDLGHQWVTRFLEHTDLKKEDIGWIQQKTWDWQKPVTVAIIHTLANRFEDLPQNFREHFGVVIYDETHRLGAPYFNKTAHIGLGLRWGLSATPTRSDGLDPLYRHHIGPVLYQNLDQDIVPEVWFIQSPFRPTDEEYDEMRERFSNEISIPRLMTWLGAHEERNAFIAEWLDKASIDGRVILTLSDRVANLEALHARYDHASLITGKVKGADRERLLQDYTMVFATTQLAKEGLDKATLDTVAISLPFTDEYRFQQIIGRTQRAAPGKRTPVILIFEDVRVPICNNMCHKLRSHLRKWKIPFKQHRTT